MGVKFRNPHNNPKHKWTRSKSWQSCTSNQAFHITSIAIFDKVRVGAFYMEGMNEKNVTHAENDGTG